MAKIQSDKGRSTKEEGKELKASKRKDRCYRCGQQGRIAREAPTARTEQHDAPYQWEHKGRRKGAKGKQAQDRCYKCGQQGHIDREALTATTEQHDTTYQWYEDPHGYDNYCWHSMSHQGQQLALPAQHTTHQQSREFLEYIALNQSLLHMYTKAMQNRQSTTLTLWSAAV